MATKSGEIDIQRYVCNVGDAVLCYHGPEAYHAKCLQVRAVNNICEYLVHYSGWKKRWDEWVTDDRIIIKNNTIQINDKKLKRGLAISLPSTDTPSTDTSSNVSLVNGSPSVVNTKRRQSVSSKKSKESADTPQPEIMLQNGSDLPSPLKRKRIQNYLTVRYNIIHNDIDIRVPLSLLKILVRDFHLICRGKKLVNFPETHTVKAIMDFYSQHCEKTVQNQVDMYIHKECALGVVFYFDTYLPRRLLYQEERLQYKDLIAKHKEQPSKLYGFIHLMRLFVYLGNMLQRGRIHDYNTVGDSLCHCLMFLTRFKKIFKCDYIDRDTDYEERMSKMTK